MTDLTGWTPHEGGPIPPELLEYVGKDPANDVIVLLRGTPEHGPRESGPAPALALNWHHAPAEPNYQPSPADIIRGKAPQYPSGDIIGWRYADDEGGARYPNVVPNKAEVDTRA